MDSLYKKYRPLQLRDMIGQSHVIRTLGRATATRQFNHAYLFAGQHGSGKTTAARVLAATIVCPNIRKSQDEMGMPCGVCKTCKSIHSGYCVDVFEMDGADKRKIEDARKIIETCQYPPQELSHKVYIIDEVHGLTGEAASSLLKTIEEPPPHVIFILCTTEIRKIIPTIKSRCQRLLFTKIPATEIASRLTAVAGREGITLEAQAAESIARNARGSMRDAYGDLEQISLAEDRNVTSEAVSRNLGTPEQMVTYQLVTMMVNQDIPGLFRTVDSLMQIGVDPRIVLAEVSEVFRNIMIFVSCGTDSTILEVMPEEKKTLEELSKKITMKTVLRVGKGISEIEKDLSVNVNERFVLEAALVNGLLHIRNDVAEQITT